MLTITSRESLFGKIRENIDITRKFNEKLEELKNYQEFYIFTNGKIYCKIN